MFSHRHYTLIDRIPSILLESSAVDYHILSLRFHLRYLHADDDEFDRMQIHSCIGCAYVRLQMELCCGNRVNLDYLAGPLAPGLAGPGQLGDTRRKPLKNCLTRRVWVKALARFLRACNALLLANACIESSVISTRRGGKLATLPRLLVPIFSHQKKTRRVRVKSRFELSVYKFQSFADKAMISGNAIYWKGIP